MIKRLILLLLAVSLISACGFKLRGALDFSADISPLYFQSNSAFELGRDIKSLLLSNKIQIVDNDTQAKASLIIIKESKSRRVLSVDSNGRAREYLLSYKVQYSISQGLALNKLKTNTVSLSRSLLFDENAVLAVSNESEILYKDMRRDAARLILLKLQVHTAKSEEKK